MKGSEPQTTEPPRATLEVKVGGMAAGQSVDGLLAESERELVRFDWDGTFAEYLGMVIENPAASRLSHALVYDAITAGGESQASTGEPAYRLFEDKIFGLESALQSIVQYFAASARRMEVRKRILLLLGPPASGKSTIVDIIKNALEEYSRSDEGAVYAIHGCPMQEEPLHLIPRRLRPKLLEDHGVYTEGDLCLRCRYVLRTEYLGKISEMPITRVTLSEQEAVGIGYYLATNPNPTDSSLLVGSVDQSKLEGDRQEVAGRAFRLDGELNVANRGLMEFVEIFKADKHMLTTLLGLAQEQVIKMEKFGSVYADEVVVGHSNEGDFATFTSDEHSEALKDRIIAINIPYNLRVTEEVKIYDKMLKTSVLHDTHLAPLTLPVVSVFAVLSRLEPPEKQGLTLIDKLRLYDGRVVRNFTAQDRVEMQRHHTEEGMSGISPRYVMNRLSEVTSGKELACVTPLAALDSMWRGLRENVSLDTSDSVKFVGFVLDTIKEYNALVIRDVQKAFEESFEESARMLFEGYLANVETFCGEPPSGDRKKRAERAAMERDMRELERAMGVTERNKNGFREEIEQLVAGWRDQNGALDYRRDPRIGAAVETKLLPDHRTVERSLSQPRFARQRAEWASRRAAISGRMKSDEGYCDLCAEDAIEYALHVLKSKPVLKTPKSEGVEWLWPLTPA